MGDYSRAGCTEFPGKKRKGLVITAREALDRAVEQLATLLPGAVSDPLLEEIEDDPASGIWRVTISFARPGLATPPVTSDGKIPTWNPLTGALLRKAQRHYRSLEIDRETGALRAMRMRETSLS
jgi:hypothetical protein